MSEETQPEQSNEQPAPEVAMSQEAFTERLARAKRSAFKDLGFDDPEQLKAFVEQSKKLQEQAEERRKAEMSEIERLREEAQREAQRREQLESQLAEERYNAQVAAACSKLGIRDLDYAGYVVSKAASSLPEGQELSIEATLSERLKSNAAAFGVVTNAPTPATTTPTEDKPTAPSGAAAVKSKPVGQMSDTEFAAHMASLGIEL